MLLSRLQQQQLPRALDLLWSRLGGLNGKFFSHGWGNLSIVNLQEDLQLIQQWPPKDMQVREEGVCLCCAVCVGVVVTVTVQHVQVARGSIYQQQKPRAQTDTAGSWPAASVIAEAASSGEMHVNSTCRCSHCLKHNVCSVFVFTACMQQQQFAAATRWPMRRSNALHTCRHPHSCALLYAAPVHTHTHIYTLPCAD